MNHSMEAESSLMNAYLCGGLKLSHTIQKHHTDNALFMFAHMLRVSSVTVAVEIKDMKWTATQADSHKRNGK
jgi:hypothetical protein